MNKLDASLASTIPRLYGGMTDMNLDMTHESWPHGPWLLESVCDDEDIADFKIYDKLYYLYLYGRVVVL